jgi:hypothetical protein
MALFFIFGGMFGKNVIDILYNKLLNFLWMSLTSSKKTSSYPRLQGVVEHHQNSCCCIFLCARSFLLQMFSGPGCAGAWHPFGEVGCEVRVFSSFFGLFLCNCV